MNRRILGLALPNIITNITVPLLGMVDMAIVGRLSASHIGAIAIGGQIFNLIYWNFGQKYGRSSKNSGASPIDSGLCCIAVVGIAATIELAFTPGF